MNTHLDFTDQEEWKNADTLREDLTKLKTPDSLLKQISFRDAHVRKDGGGPQDNLMHYPPPWPGCCFPPGIGSARIWGDFLLKEWFDAAPWIFGSGYSKESVFEYDAITVKLRASGEGSKTMLALDLLWPGEWLTHNRPGLSVSDLVQWGPKLSADLIAEIDSHLDRADIEGAGGPAGQRHGWGRLKGKANSLTTYHYVECFQTTWEAGI